MNPRVTDEMVAPRSDGRIYGQQLRPLLGDCAPSGRIRLDAIARWLQDVAFCDVEDAGVADQAMWVVRRTRINVSCFPRFGDHCAVRTFCSGFGRMWAERRTTIALADSVRGQRATDGGKPLVEAVALWIHLDPERRTPSLLTRPEIEKFGSSAGDRRIPHRLRHPRPEEAAPVRGWSFRGTDCDLADHVNNAAFWELLEEELLEREHAEGCEIGAVAAEIEFRAAVQPGPKTVLADGEHRWLVDPVSDGERPGEVYASALLSGAQPTPAAGG